MKIITLTILFALFTVNVFAQNDKLNPETDSFNSRTGIFESKEGGFKAYFPTKPEKTVNKLENAFGTSDFVIYMSESPTSVYGVSYFDMPTVMTQDFEKTLNYNSQRDALINGTNGKLLSDNVFEFNEHNGREFVIFGNDSVIKMRTFFVKQRLFRNLIILPADDENSALVKIKASQGLIKKFFESFAVTELPTPKTSVVELPENFAVKIDNNTFYSGYFDLSIKIPAGFRILGKKEADFAKHMGLEKSKNSTIRNKELLNLSYNRTAILMIAVKTGKTEPDASQILTIAAESMSFPDFSPKFLADFYINELVQGNETKSKNTQEELIGGKQFAWVETLNNKNNFKHRVYFANVKGLAFQISYIYKTGEELNEFLQMLKTMNFDNQK
jgi:hypothetical protein